MNKRRVLLWIATVCLLTTLISSTVLAATNDGWNQNDDGTWSYYDAGSPVCNEVRNIGGKYYGFDWNGIMYEDTTFYVNYYDETVGYWKDDWYRAKADGTLYVGEWYQEGGQHYYYSADGKQCREGVYSIDGKYYGFDWNGVIFADTTFELYDNVAEKWVYYRAKADGTLYVGEWYETDYGERYYYGAAGKGAEDFTKIGDTWYFFDNARIIKNQMVWSELYQANYYISEDGKSSTKAPENGWLAVGDKYYYFSNGEKYQSGLYQIGGKYYGFDWEGTMYADTTFSFGVYDETVGYWKYDLYRAKADGAVYVNEWYQNGDTWYYYGAMGKAPNDFFQVGTTWYYFENGRMVTDRLVYSENYQAYYVISKDGKSSRAITADGWVAVGEDYYYAKDGEIYRSGVYQIGGKYYGFNWDGVMFADTTFYSNYYDEAADIWYYGEFRAKADGAVYVNEWYQNGDTWYYYGAMGKAPNDFFKVGTTWYYFENGRMVTDRLVYSENYQAYYVISKDGKSSRAITADGWVNVGEDYYYAKDGEIYRSGVYQIGGKYYGFNWEGAMYADTTFYTSYYDEAADIWYNGEFRAKADGSLYVGEWYQSGSAWYYYGAAGLGADDFVQVGTTWYYFENGRMVTDRLVYSENYQAYYVISKDGKSSRAVAANGWVAVGEDYYYIQDGTLCRGGVYQIGGKYYGFDWEGVMYADTTFDLYDNVAEKWVWYRAKADGTLYVGEWYETEYGEWYYYGAAGKGADGFTQINGAWYCFSYARMLKDQIVYSEGSYYALDKDGQQIKTQGKHAVSGSYVYVQADGTAVEEDWVQISGKWHYFGPYMVANTVCQIDGKLYAADNAGVCVAVTGNGIYDIGVSGKVYLESGKISEGWKQVGGSWYYFNPRMYKNDVYKIEDTYYVFDQNGKLYTGGWILLGNGSDWYGEEGFSYAYADASGKAAIGLQTIGGKQYIFDEYGYMYTDTTVILDGVAYVIDESGVAKTVVNGWMQVDGKYYYVKNGELVRGRMLEIGGKRYAFAYDGEMMAGSVSWVEGGDVLTGADGVVKTGWQKHGGDWYYAGTNGYLVEGKQTIGGKTYVFDYDYSLKIGTFWWDGMICTTDSSGAVLSEKDPADGWTYVNGSVFYYKNGERYTGWVGDYLIVDGYMAINDWRSWEDDYYAFDIYGKYVKSGWHQFDYGYGYHSEYVYAKPGGKLCHNEWYAINGNWYYFSGVYMLSDGIYEIEGELCKFAADGRYLGKVSAPSGEGWKQAGGAWYYLHAGEPVVGVQWINGERYVFDYNGVLVSGGFAWFEDVWYYTDSDGKIPNYTGWKKLNGEWCYFNSSNLPVTGWFQDNGKIYYGQVKQDEDTVYVAVATGYLYTGGELQYFDANGVYQGTKGVDNGWFKADGEWYYFRNGKAVDGYQVIDGKGYYFSYGAMQTNVITYRGYFGSDGVQRTTKGWYKTSAGWIYVKDDGTLCNGVHKIGDKEYYFANYVMIR